MEKYILIQSEVPCITEFSEHLYVPELKRSSYVIKLNSSNKFENNNSTQILYDQFKIEIVDNKKNPATILINHLSITNIEYDYSTFKLCFFINQGQTVYGQRVFTTRTNPANPDIRLDIVEALKKLAEIPTSLSIATINKI